MAAVVAVVAAVATVVEEELAAGSPLDHREVLELLRLPVDPEGETLLARVLVHIMTRLGVEGLDNTFKLSEGAPEQLDSELSLIEERFLGGVLGRRSFPFSNFFRRWFSSSSSSIRPRFHGGGLLDAISSFYR
jgi:hypothetical protein